MWRESRSLGVSGSCFSGTWAFTASFVELLARHIIIQKGINFLFLFSVKRITSRDSASTCHWGILKCDLSLFGAEFPPPPGLLIIAESNCYSVCSKFFFFIFSVQMAADSNAHDNTFTFLKLKVINPF